ncbi:MAG TPA: hypothetical protein PK231_10735 [Acidocella sp.]|nr:hypothetical protein [Acidocella sp.]
MTSSTDMRIEIVMGGSPGTTDAVLAEAGHQVPSDTYAVTFAPGKPGHVIGCTCCTPRGPVADALTAMFRARATGKAPFFHRVVVLASPEGEAVVREAVVSDVVSAARYRL